VVASPLAGIPVTLKDLFDVRGNVTAAGSSMLRTSAPAAHDAPVVARLRAAGAVIVARTHMSEFAFSGLGTNPHSQRLANPRDSARVCGGSSSGAAASVAAGCCAIGLGTDTGGSTRIPAAYCGIVGWKPTQRRITRQGAFALSESLDSIGPLGNSVECCALADSVIADAPIEVADPPAIGTLRLAVPQDVVLADLDAEVAAAFERALGALTDAGAYVERIPFPAFSLAREAFSRGTIANYEAFHHHRRLGLMDRRTEYDPNVRARLEIGEHMSDAHYADLLAARRRIIAAADAQSVGFSALVFPTAAGVAPRFIDIEDPAAWAAANARALRNASLVNVLDRCALSIPMHHGAELPTGLMVMGDTMQDARTLAVGRAIEAALRDALLD
jgi:aspartyl-tRNA(Asn)/glutamyl-tRNA(Gln) amidotransferase subunit A